MHDRDARRARWITQACARRRARRDAWRRSGGDHQRYREIMGGHIAAGHLYYYEHEDEPAGPGPGYVPASAIWRDCARQMARWSAVYAIAAALIVASDQCPLILYLTLDG